MATRREFVKALPAMGTAFAVGGHLMLDDSPARAQGAASPLVGHFDPKGKAPSKFTLDALLKARGEVAEQERAEDVLGERHPRPAGSRAGVRLEQRDAQQRADHPAGEDGRQLASVPTRHGPGC